MGHERVWDEALSAQNLRAKLAAMSEEDRASFMKRFTEDELLQFSKELRSYARAELSVRVSSPRALAIRDAYPFVPEDFFTTALTFGFNMAVNNRREKKFEEKDKKDFAATGTTAALKILASDLGKYCVLAQS
jgi:hypothetical protein